MITFVFDEYISFESKGHPLPRQICLQETFNVRINCKYINSKGVWTWKHLKEKGSMDIHYAITISTNWDSIWSVLIKSSGCYNLTQPEPSKVTSVAGVPMARRTKNSDVRSPENTTLCISPLCSALYLAPFCSFYSPDLSVSPTECLRRQFPGHQVTSVSVTQFQFLEENFWWFILAQCPLDQSTIL